MAKRNVLYCAQYSPALHLQCAHSSKRIIFLMRLCRRPGSGKIKLAEIYSGLLMQIALLNT